MINAITIAVCTFTLSYCLYFISIRLTGRSDRFAKYGVVAWVVSVCPLVFFAHLELAGKLTLLVAYTGLWVLAIHFMAGVANSVTLFMLQKCVERGGGTFSIQTLRQFYDQNAATRGRLNSLIDGGFATLSNHRYEVTPRGRQLLMVFEATKFAFAVKRLG